MATERVGIEIEIMGYEEAMNHMRNLERSLKGLKGIKVRKDLASRLKELQRNSAALRAEAERLKAAMAGVARGSAEWNEYSSRLRQVRREMSQTASEAQRVRQAMRNISSASQMFKRNVSAIGHVGSAMQSLGNAMQRLLTPWRLLAGGALLGAGYGAINKIEEGLASGFQRHDTMKKYPRIMERMGFSGEKAQKSIDKLNEAVDGMPTRLDDIVGLAQKYTLATGDIEKGTETAIAANNAFLASMSSETERYQGMLQINDLLNGKKLQDREWQSLIGSMGAGINAVGKELGYADDEMGKFRQDLKSGKVSGDEFLDTLRKVGGKDGELGKLARESMDTWEAFSSRIGTAFSRMTDGILTCMDDIVASFDLKDEDGNKIESLNMFLDSKVIPGINNMAKSAQKWIKAHPDEIVDFFKSLGDINWASLGKGFLDGMGTLVKGIKWIADNVKGKDLSWIGDLFSKLIIAAPILTIGGGVFKGLRHILGAIVTAVEILGAGTGAIAIGQATTNIGKIIALIKGVGKVGKAASEVATIGGGAGAAAGSAGISKAFGPIAKTIGAIGGIITEIVGIAAIDTWLISKAVDNIKSITDGIQGIFDSVGKIKGGFNKGTANTLRNAVNDVFSIYDILYGEKKTSRAIGKTNVVLRNSKGLSNMKKGKLKSIKESVGAMDAILKYMGSIDKSVGSFKGFKGFNKKSLTGINNFIESLGKMYDDLDKSFAENIDEERATELSDIVGQSKGMFDSIGQIVTTIPALSKNLAKVTSKGKGGNGKSMIETVKKNLTGEGGVLSLVPEIMDAAYASLRGQGENGQTNYGVGNVTAISGMMTDVEAMFTGISNFLGKIPDIKKKLAGLSQSAGSPGSGTTVFGTIKWQITTMMDQIGEIIASIDKNISEDVDITGKTDSLVIAVDNIRKASNKLAKLGEGNFASTDTGVFTAIDNIKQMISQLGNALRTDTMTQLETALTGFATAVNDMFAALNKSFESVEVKVKIKGTVTGHKELISKIKAANSAIRGAVQGITNSYTRHVYVHIQRHVDVTGDTVPSNSEIVPHHTGGLVPAHGTTPLYRSKGGSIFRPRGVDTVPAMLQPGEYVQSKKAVDFFGVKFMQKLNHLDVKGAMRELSARVGANAVAGRGMTIYNHITNNNQTVNQNVRTSNPNFAFRRSRYIAAL